MVILNYGMIAMFANDEDTDRNTGSSKSVSSILDDSDSEDTVPGMSAELGAYRSSKTEPIQTDPLQFWKNKEST